MNKKEESKCQTIVLFKSKSHRILVVLFNRFVITRRLLIGRNVDPIRLVRIHKSGLHWCCKSSSSIPTITINSRVCNCKIIKIFSNYLSKNTHKVGANQSYTPFHLPVAQETRSSEEPIPDIQTGWRRMPGAGPRTIGH